MTKHAQHIHISIFSSRQQRDSTLMSLYCVAVKLMIQRGKREGTRSRPVWREGGREGGGRGGADRRGASGLCVVCEDLCPSVRGSACTSSSVYLLSSWVSHFSPLAHSHLSPRGKYIRTLKCTVMQHASGCPGCTLVAL